MATARMRIASAALALIAAGCLYAQSPSTGRSVSIQIVAVIPPVLRLALDFCAGEIAQVNAYLHPKNGAEDSRIDATRHEIREGSVIELGNARIFSNTGKSYSVQVYSANGGNLRPDSGPSTASIPYSLSLDGIPARNRDGAFSFQTRGKTTMEGTALRVALAIAAIPASASGGDYSDQLLFSLAAN